MSQNTDSTTGKNLSEVHVTPSGVASDQSSQTDEGSSILDQPIYHDIERNLDTLLDEFGRSPDVIIRRLDFCQAVSLRIAVIYIEGLTDQQALSENVLSQITTASSSNQSVCQTEENGQPQKEELLQAWSTIKNKLTVGSVVQTGHLSSVASALLAGSSVLFAEGVPSALICSTKGGKSREISEASTQVVIRGPKDSFTESIETNFTLVRRRIRSKLLRLETINIGSVSHTSVAIMYLQDTAPVEIVERVRQTLSSINMEAVLESGYIEKVLQDSSFSPFPTVYNTERPDIVAGNLLDGRITIFVDGTPFALIVPTVFSQFFTSPEDYYQRYDIGLFIRFLRYISFIISMIAPSFYVALITYHQEMIPTPLLISLAGGREDVPFPAIVEALLMEFSFEILREAGIRLPRAVGQAVSIIGAIVIGEAAVQAGIVSQFMIIVVAITGIASFSAPFYNIAITARLLKFSFLILAGIFGFFGIALGMITLIGHMNSLRSVGTPFMAPFSPFKLQAFRDTLLLPTNHQPSTTTDKSPSPD
ncbi:spore germination protein KA [Paenibacillus sophorae]|uniref:Spore germination protein n=1 Tax=Paenibacillus sophorae TaxID=1333845 RepID=A0A1H8FF49_9BACL|nr:spore germination protein [Paenibacillus sophorae]QWU13854.1 spore germination protein [Paenibacillus sophorae]SEN30246.1 spore germination protein KA [Paenibacillus sophorae]